MGQEDRIEPKGLWSLGPPEALTGHCFRHQVPWACHAFQSLDHRYGCNGAVRRLEAQQNSADDIWRDVRARPVMNEDGLRRVVGKTFQAAQNRLLPGACAKDGGEQIEPLRGFVVGALIVGSDYGANAGNLRMCGEGCEAVAEQRQSRQG